MKRITTAIIILALSASVTAGPSLYPPPETGVGPWITLLSSWLRIRYGWVPGPNCHNGNPC